MKPLFIILIVLIIISILYLVYRNIQYQKILESFDNTRSSLSTYYQNTTDSDSYQTDDNIHNGVDINVNKVTTTISKWDGVWENFNDNIFCIMIALNDKLFFSLSNSNLTNVISNGDLLPKKTDTDICPQNTFLGIGQLNHPRTKFVLKEVICDNYVNSSLNMVPNGLSGKLDNNIVTLYSNGNTIQVRLNKVKDLSYDSDSFYKQPNFLKLFSPFIRNYPILERSFYSLTAPLCVNSTPCNALYIGLNSNNPEMPNACGTTKSGSDNTCATINCVNVSNYRGEYSVCPPNTDIVISDYMSFSGLNSMNLSSGNSLKSCDYLDNFNEEKYNSCIICYVSAVQSVFTLNYQFFGVLPNESSLTLQKDMMDGMLNSDNGLVNTYKDNIMNGFGDLGKAISLTNCMEFNNETGTQREMENKCLPICKKYINDGVVNNRPPNNQLNPTVWQINYKVPKNYVNNCRFVLSTSKFYKLAVKYANFNDDGTNNLSLYGGDYKQDLMIENYTILKQTEKLSIISTNIKTNSGLYLVPSVEKGGFSNNSLNLSYKEYPNQDGKWLIIGFHLKNIDDLTNFLNTSTLSGPVNKNIIFSLSGSYQSVPSIDNTNKCTISNNGNVVMFDDPTRGMVFSFSGRNYLTINVETPLNFTISAWTYYSLPTPSPTPPPSLLPSLLTSLLPSSTPTPTPTPTPSPTPSIFKANIFSCSTCKLYYENGNIYASINDEIIAYRVNTIDTWTHFAITYSNSSNTLTLYINGENIIETNIESWKADTGHHYIGSYNNTHNWIGYLSDIQEFKVALSDDEIKNLYQLENK